MGALDAMSISEITGILANDYHRPLRALVITQGPPGCGKTTWASRYVDEINSTYKEMETRAFKGPSRDDLRALRGYPPLGNTQQESKVSQIQRKAIRGHFSSSCSRNTIVVIDDTNVSTMALHNMKIIAEENNAFLVIKRFEVPREECLRRCRDRGYRPISASVWDLIDSRLAGLDNAMIAEAVVTGTKIQLPVVLRALDRAGIGVTGPSPEKALEVLLSLGYGQEDLIEWFNEPCVDDRDSFEEFLFLRIGIERARKALGAALPMVSPPSWFVEAHQRAQAAEGDSVRDASLRGVIKWFIPSCLEEARTAVVRMAFGLRPEVQGLREKLDGSETAWGQLWGRPLRGAEDDRLAVFAVMVVASAEGDAVAFRRRVAVAARMIPHKVVRGEGTLPSAYWTYTSSTFSPRVFSKVGSVAAWVPPCAEALASVIGW